MTKPLRWGIIGSGRINRRFVGGLKQTDHRLVILGSRDPQRAQAAAAEYGAERAGRYEDVLHATDVDAVYVCPANSLHVPWTIRAAEAGKHVLCEKPMAPTVAECHEMVAACQRHGVHLVEGFMYRHHPAWRVVRSVIDSGSLGEIRMLRAHFSFNMAQGPNIRLQPDLGGGAIQDVGCYCVNVARWFLGEPRRVQGAALDLRGVGVDTHAAATLEFPSGALAQVSCSFDSAGFQAVEIFGDRGRLELRPSFLITEQASLRIVDAAGEREEPVPVADSYAEEALAMARLIHEGVPSLTPGSDAAFTQTVIAAWRGNE